ncbi:Uncharacterised protein [uncultured archaeon]|nr:Uncharacterised protein [uncultured archaeon]
MHKSVKIGLYGFLIWLIPFAVSVLIFPLRATQRPLFESIMPVVLVIWTVFFSIVYLLGIKSGFQKESILLGIIWLLIGIFFDLLIFIAGPLKMALWDYMTDIGVMYLIIPTITSGFGYLMERHSRN